MGNYFYKKTHASFPKLERGFKENAASYLLFLRWAPLFPFPIVNIAAAFFRVKLATFIWTTFIGMIPSVIVYTQAGRSLGEILRSSTPLSPGYFFNQNVLILFIALSLLALLPIYLKKCFHFSDMNSIE